MGDRKDICIIQGGGMGKKRSERAKASSLREGSQWITPTTGGKNNQGTDYKYLWL